MYDIFGKYGALRQVRLGNAADTRGHRVRRLRGHLRREERSSTTCPASTCAAARLVVLFYQQTKMQKRLDTERGRRSSPRARRLGIDGGDAGATLHKAT